MHTPHCATAHVTLPDLKNPILPMHQLPRFELISVDRHLAHAPAPGVFSLTHPFSPYVTPHFPYISPALFFCEQIGV